MRIHVTFQEKQGFYVLFDEPCEQLNVTFGEISIKYTGEIEDYDGDYSVVPKVTSQTLLTENKRMESNVFIYEIPYAETTNTYGGMTASIGGL